MAAAGDLPVFDPSFRLLCNDGEDNAKTSRLKCRINEVVLQLEEIEKTLIFTGKTTRYYANVMSTLFLGDRNVRRLDQLRHRDELIQNLDKLYHRQRSTVNPEEKRTVISKLPTLQRFLAGSTAFSTRKVGKFVFLDFSNFSVFQMLFYGTRTRTCWKKERKKCRMSLNAYALSFFATHECCNI